MKIIVWLTLINKQKELSRVYSKNLKFHLCELQKLINPSPIFSLFCLLFSTYFRLEAGEHEIKASADLDGVVVVVVARP